MPEERRAFTLIELLAVIAIIAILAALLLPAISKSKAATQSIVCANHMHQLATAAAVYNGDAGRLPSMLEWLYPRALPLTPPRPTPFPVGGVIVPPSMDLARGQLYPYVQSRVVYCCPSETGSIPPFGPIDHSYQIPCMTCHVHDAARALVPARSVYFLEVTNQMRGIPTGIAMVPAAPSLAFRHAKRENFVFMDTHFEKLTRAQYNAAAADLRFWYPTTRTDMSGQP